MRSPLEELLSDLRQAWPNEFPQAPLSREEYLRLEGAHKVIRWIETRARTIETKALTRGRIGGH